MKKTRAKETGMNPSSWSSFNSFYLYRLETFHTYDPSLLEESASMAHALLLRVGFDSRTDSAAHVIQDSAAHLLSTSI